MYCDQVKSFFTEHGVSFVVKDIKKDQQAFREWREKYQGDLVPLIVFGNGKCVIDGWDQKAMQRVLQLLKEDKR